MDDSQATLSEGAPHTPMMRQYLETKAAHPDAVLFFRLGDFYEMFFEDAVMASELLQITLTARAKGADRVPMCGVPYHSARRYIARLVEAGHKVAICEQVEEPGGKGIVRREVVRTITPGMLLDEEVLESRENNFLAAVVPARDGRLWGAALLDASTGEFAALAERPLPMLADEISRTGAKELLTPEDLRGTPELEALQTALGRRLPLASLPRSAFEPRRAAAFLKTHFRVASLDGFGVDEASAATGAAGAALRYLKDTQRTEASHVDRLTLSVADGTLVMDEASCANLELLKSLKDGGRKGSLLGVMDRTATAMGARKLARWLSAPLGTLEPIVARHEAVEELTVGGVLRDELVERLRQVGDIERLCGRLALGMGNARDLRALGSSLRVLGELEPRLGRAKAMLLRALSAPLGAPTLAALAKEIERAIVEEPPVSTKEGGLVRQGYDPDLDTLVELSTSGKEFLVRLEARERERTGIQSLKVRYNRVFGYYLEVTRSNLHLVPSDYQRKQTTVNSERFVTPELKEYEVKVLTAEEQRCERELAIFERLRGQVVAAAREIRAAAEAVATIDALASFARCAVEFGYVRPVVDGSDVIDIVGGRHPVVERMLQGETFVPNDVRLDGSDAQLLVITGPNMAGKSTVMRQVALTVVLAQSGSFVPAVSARIGVCDRVFTRVGASDNLARGQSTFMVEMTETANILHHATRRSLVVLDEIGRGTSTYDGLSIAWAVAEHLHDEVGARTLFATHYHELTELARDRRRVRNCSIAVKEHHGKIVFLRKLVDGGASRSYGIEVARLAGLPPEVVGRAKELLHDLEAQGARRAKAAPAKEQLGLFASPKDHPILEELQRLTVDAMTPLEALNALARWKREHPPS